ncbi:MAG: polysaccharide biosynthesis/export family protein [Bacillota bacterium]|nr:polysaccharide biosynthesis/export family protein [Bacillota bacterium]
MRKIRIHKMARLWLRICLYTASCGAMLAQQAAPVGAVNASSSLPLTGSQQAHPTENSNSVLTAVPDDFSTLRLAPGFFLHVSVYDEPEFDTHTRVDEKGDISLPLLGSIHVGGKTIPEAQSEIQEKFRSSQILKDPQVTLNVEQYVSSSVTVLGEVQSPGRIQLLAQHNLLDVIGMAGGETNLAGDTIQVESHSENGTTVRTYHYSRGQNENEARNVMVSPGDVIRVQRAGIVYVLGAVNRPGGYVMQEDGSLNVAQAISLAMGTTMQARIGGIRVVRHDPSGNLSEIPIDYKDIVSGKQKPIQLEAEDIVYVPVSKLKSVFTAGSGIIGQTGAATIYAVK